MNGNVEMLVREFQADRARELEKRMLAKVAGENADTLSNRERAVLWAGGLLVQWGQGLQAIGDSAQETASLRGDATLATATK